MARSTPIALVLAFAGVAPASALELRLRCEGVGIFPQTQSTSVSVMGNGSSASGSATTVSRGRVRDVFDVDIGAAASRVRPPLAIVPPINSGSRDGWWSLAETAVTEEQITGKFRLNPFNKPTVKIDRRTGEIDVRGSFQLSFRGTCEPVAPQERRF